jgi:hypothetical protein
MRTAEERRARFAEREADRNAKYAQRMAEIREQKEAREAARKADAEARQADAGAHKVARQAANDERQAARQEAKAQQRDEFGSITERDTFTHLGVQIMRNGDLHTFNGFGGYGTRLGPASGAEAFMGDEKRRHRVSGAVSSAVVLGPVGLLGAVGKKEKASAYVQLADGTLRSKKLDGNTVVSAARRQIIAFNAAVARLG